MSIIDLAGKVVIVTGGAQGIGRAIVTDCARSGADIVIADLNEEMAQATAQEVGQLFAQKIVAVRTDVTSLESVQQMKEATIQHFGRIDILINNAGWDQFIPFLKTTPEFWEKIIDLNYKGVLNTCYTFLPQMVAAKSGSIVNVASDAGRGGSMGESIYAGCKAGIIAFSKTLAREHARDNIRVNVVSPGITETGLYDDIVATDFGQKVMDAIVKSVPLGRRGGQPGEISPAVVFLASEAARYITGQVLSVNGGLTMVD
jgi:2-hydroxycyclohexanecarboxyl-CoA dehydrogenase